MNFMWMSITLPAGWAQRVPHPASEASGQNLSGAAGRASVSAAGRESRGGAQVAGPAAQPRVSVSYGPMLPAQLDVDPWILRVLAENLPPGTQPVIAHREPDQTATGFPMLVVKTLLTRADGSIPEARLSAFYNMMSSCAVVVVRATGPVSPAAPGSPEPAATPADSASAVELLTEHEGAAREMFKSAVPNWESGLCTIAALYEGLPQLWETK